MIKIDADNPDFELGAVDHAKWQVDDYCDLRGQKGKPDRGPDYIENLARAGEVCLIGSSSKAGKSWLVGNLIWSAVSGCLWLGREVRQGKVLLIDNELKRREIDWRHDAICYAMKHHAEPGQLKVMSRRGQPCDIQAVELQISLLDWDWSEYSFIVIDALYKVIPDGKSENDNEAMGKLMNVLQGIAERTDVPVIGVHHSTKGSQGDKAVLDVFAGAGSFGRALDSAVVVRDHEQPELSVIDFRTRSHEPQPAQSAKFEWPLWNLVTVEPELKKFGRTTERAAADDKKADDTIRGLFTSQPGKCLSESQLVRMTGMGPTRISRAIGRAVTSGFLKQRKVRRLGRKTVVYKLSATESAT